MKSRDEASSETGTQHNTTQQPQEEVEVEDKRREHRRRGKAGPQHTYHLERSEYGITFDDTTGIIIQLSTTVSTILKHIVVVFETKRIRAAKVYDDDQVRPTVRR